MLSPTRFKMAPVTKREDRQRVKGVREWQLVLQAHNRQRLTPFLIDKLNRAEIKGLTWIEKKRGIFRIPWKHGGTQDWSPEHSQIFKEWARHTGKFREGLDTPEWAKWKTRIRCAFNKSPDIMELKELSQPTAGKDPFKVYQFKGPLDLDFYQPKNRPQIPGKDGTTAGIHRVWVCPFCSQIFNSKDNGVKHMCDKLPVTTVNIYKCQQCDFTTTKDAEFVAHSKSQHPDDKSENYHDAEEPANDEEQTEALKETEKGVLVNEALKPSGRVIEVINITPQPMKEIEREEQGGSDEDTVITDRKTIISQEGATSTHTEEEGIQLPYACEKCDFCTMSEPDYEQHLKDHNVVHPQTKRKVKPTTVGSSPPLVPVTTGPTPPKVSKSDITHPLVPVTTGPTPPKVSKSDITLSKMAKANDYIIKFTIPAGQKIVSANVNEEGKVSMQLTPKARIINIKPQPKPVLGGSIVSTGNQVITGTSVQGSAGQGVEYIPPEGAKYSPNVKNLFEEQQKGTRILDLSKILRRQSSNIDNNLLTDTPAGDSTSTSDHLSEEDIVPAESPASENPINLSLEKTKQLPTIIQKTAPIMADSRRLRPWLIDHLNTDRIPGLTWLDKEKKVFKMNWVHAGNPNWAPKHGQVFKEWALHTGRYREGVDSPEWAKWKTRIRCAFNKSPDIVEVKQLSRLTGETCPYRVFKFLDFGSTKEPKQTRATCNVCLEMFPNALARDQHRLVTHCNCPCTDCRVNNRKGPHVSITEELPQKEARAGTKRRRQQSQDKQQGDTVDKDINLKRPIKEEKRVSWEACQSADGWKLVIDEEEDGTENVMDKDGENSGDDDDEKSDGEAGKLIMCAKCGFFTKDQNDYSQHVRCHLEEDEDEELDKQASHICVKSADSGVHKKIAVLRQTSEDKVTINEDPMNTDDQSEESSTRNPDKHIKDISVNNPQAGPNVQIPAVGPTGSAPGATVGNTTICSPYVEAKSSEAQTLLTHNCSHCGKIYKSLHYLNIHMQTHLDGIVLLCDECGDGFEEEPELIRHKVEHAMAKLKTKKLTTLRKRKSSDGERASSRALTQYTCPKCKVAFDSPAAYEHHLESAHMLQRHPPAVTVHKCHQCGATYPDATALHEHCREHTRHRRLQQKEATATANDKPKFKCFDCSESFHEFEMFIKHAATHTDGTQSKCSICGEEVSVPAMSTEGSGITVEIVCVQCQEERTAGN